MYYNMLFDMKIDKIFFLFFKKIDYLIYNATKSCYFIHIKKI